MNSIKIGQNIELHIEKMASEGQGIAKYNGMTIFVEKAIVGETVLAKITKVKKDYAAADTMQVMKASPYRVKPLCPVYDMCGGCQLQHMSYEGELIFKKNKIEDALKRIGNIDVAVNNVIGMDEPYYYRNKAQYPIAYVDGRASMGFYKGRSHDIVPIKNCMIQNKRSEAIAKEILDFIREYNISVYNEKTKQGLIRHIMTRYSYSTGEVMVAIVAKENRLPHREELIDRLKNMDGFAGLILNVNPSDTNVVLGNTNILLYGKDRIIDEIGGLKYYISPQSFFQVNPIQTEILYSKALQFADLKEDELVIDAYCGVGTISLFLAKRAKKVIGIEVVEKAIEDAKENAKLNNISNADFIAGRSEDIMKDLKGRGVKPDVIVVDPPRKGCDSEVLQSMIDMAPERIVYISCNPATLARDLKQLKGRYNINDVQPVDMFPRTNHVESIILMTNSGSKGK